MTVTEEQQQEEERKKETKDDDDDAAGTKDTAMLLGVGIRAPYKVKIEELKSGGVGLGDTMDKLLAILKQNQGYAFTPARLLIDYIGVREVNIHGTPYIDLGDKGVSGAYERVRRSLLALKKQGVLEMLRISRTVYYWYSEKGPATTTTTTTTTATPAATTTAATTATKTTIPTPTTISEINKSTRRAGEGNSLDDLINSYIENRTDEEEAN